MYDTFSVQCEHVLPVAVLSLLSGLADGSRGGHKFSQIIEEVKGKLGIDVTKQGEYDDCFHSDFSCILDIQLFLIADHVLTSLPIF